jgi:hypothetical protein
MEVLSTDIKHKLHELKRQIKLDIKQEGFTMYFPYMRGKQHELLTLDRCRGLIQNNHNIVPIIEPVNSNLNLLNRRIRPYVQGNVPFVLVVNPQVGELRGDKISIINNVASDLNNFGNSQILGFIISENCTNADIQQFLASTQVNRICFIHNHEFSSPQLLLGLSNLDYQIFIHNKAGAAYQNYFLTEHRVIIEDGFNQQERNALYPPDEYFLDRNLNYQADNYYGFGDYLIVGQRFTKGGGAAHAVVIHLTYRKVTGGIGIRHFVSIRTTTKQDTPGKFGEALQKLISEVDSNPSILQTSAVARFRDLHNRQHFPGLGSIKEISMQHHIELMASVI